MPSKSFFEVMALIEKRPGMYVGYGERERDKQLQGLEMLVAGYDLAVNHHGIRDAGLDAFARFPEYLRDRFGWSMSCGPIVAIRNVSTSPEDAWDLFWRLLWEFRDNQVGESSSGGGAG